MSSTLTQTTLARRTLGLTARDPDRSAGGLTLFAPQTGGGAVHLLDEAGALAHRWQAPVRPGRDAVLLPNGNLGYNGSHPDSASPYAIWPLWRGGLFLEMAPDGEVVWRHEDMAHHHDCQWLEDGLLYTAAHPLPQSVERAVTGGAPAAGDGPMMGDIVRRVNRAGETIWEWKFWEHAAPEDFPIHPIFDRAHWPMINGLCLTKAGLVLMSLRTTSGVIAVDPETGGIVWTIGPGTVAQQHTPIELESGSILIFDNGNLRPGGVSPWSRAVEVDPATGEVLWSYSDAVKPAFFSPYMGGAERLWNGNTFICESAFGRLFEVTPEGETVWEYVIPDFAPYPEPEIAHYISGAHNSVFRAHRYPREAAPWL